MGQDVELKIANYLLAIEGFAMIRRFLFDPEALDARTAEVAAIVRGMEIPPLSTLISVTRHEVNAGYSMWAPRYDGPNPAIETEEPVFRSSSARRLRRCARRRVRNRAARRDPVVDGMGRDRGRRDRRDVGARPSQSARRGVSPGRLEALPVDSDSVDLVVCGLALSHVENLAPVFAEFGRVLRPGGRLVTTDMHPMMTHTGGMAAFPVTDTRPDVAAGDPMTINYVPNLEHNVHEYVAAIVAAGMTIAGCHEPPVTETIIESFPSFAAFPDATRQAFLGLPYLLIWDVRA